MNSPQVQQAQELMRRATQIEIAAAATPNDPRAKMAASAMAADLKARAAVLMQSDSYDVDQRPWRCANPYRLTGEMKITRPCLYHNPARVTKVQTARAALSWTLNRESQIG
jgi:hypothetical protein